jgi:ribosome-associated heat shock protein Hsp15
MGEGSAGSAIRLDKWLWQARFCKTRSIAARMIAEGAVRVNAVRVTKPATTVHVGDGLSFAGGGAVHAVRVRAIGTRRGPAAEARTLYLDLDAPGLPSPVPPDQGSESKPGGA